MCGIFFVNNSPLEPLFIENEFKKGSARGPDSSKLLEVKKSYMGFHRLAINGLSDSGMQPFYKHHCYLICNGEIYNHVDLYRDLKNKPNSKSDCEVILDLYIEFGIDYTCRVLDGVFAFVLYDLSKNVIYYARDPLGVRPLYYYHNNGVTGAASEVKTLVRFHNSINQFLPGCYAIVKNKSIDIYKYFEIVNTRVIYSASYDYNYYTNLIRTNLVESVKKRLMSERPIACLLSGGLDSSLITSIVVKLLKEQKVKTFSIGLKDSTDLKYAREVAKYLDTDHSEVILNEEDFFNAIPNVINIIESYDTTTVRASVGNYLICRYISENCDSKVIFNGDGADELTGGYLYFHNSPSKLHSEFETTRLLKDICYFDVLRSDKCISSCGLEPRTPFLDKSFVTCYKSIPLNFRFQPGKIEKKLLRDSFPGYLPDNVLYRTKEAFSDGVSSVDRSWFKIIEEKVKYLKMPNLSTIFTLNTPYTKEQEYYRYIFTQHYPHLESIVPYFWMPKWSNTTDPSARTIEYLNTDTHIS